MIHAVELTIRNKLLIHFQPADVVGLQAGFGLLVGGQFPEHGKIMRNEHFKLRYRKR